MFDLRSTLETTVGGRAGPRYRFRLCVVFVLVCLFITCALGTEAWAQDGGSEVTIPDEGLRCAIAAALGKMSDEPITRDEMATLRELSSSCDMAVVDLTGIEYAAALQTLNLSGNAIFDLQQLSDLRTLLILDLEDNAIVDIEPLSRLTALQTLNLADNAVADLGPVSELSGLDWLKLENNAIVDIEPLSGLTALDTLNLEGNAIADLGPLSGLKGLTWLRLVNNAIVDIEPLAELSVLGSLSLADNAIVDIEPLSGLSTLYWLSLAGNRVEDLEPLSGLSTLVSLTVTDNAVDDIAPLAELTGMEFLNLGHNAIDDIEPLSGLDSIETLGLAGNAIEDIEPLAGLTGLGSLNLSGNAIEDIEPLLHLSSLQWLNLGFNSIDDIEPLTSLTALDTLHLNSNAIGEIEPLAVLRSLFVLGLASNSIADIEPLAGLTTLGVLNLTANVAEDIEPLAGLNSLQWLSLARNRIEDLAPLAGLASLRTLYTMDNPLDAASISGHLQGLREAGATVHWNWEHHGREVVWFFPSARDPARQGFMRVINDSDVGGDVSIVAIDDRGRRHDPVTFSIEANEAVHFNSNDLESGNPGKGLPDGTGPGDGDWRLEFDSDLALWVHSYMRTADGFLTSIHDVVPVAGNGYRVATFNPGSNLRQASSLRLSNPGSEDAEVTITGIDDAGASPGMAVRVDVAAGASVTLTASDLESGTGLGGALGDGTGKWRLRLEPTQPIVAMSLLSSPTGHLTNLSTVARPVGGAYQVPLFPSAMDVLGRQGFVRVRNRSDRAGLVRIEAYDDSAGFRKAIVHLRIGAGETRHFNSQDLERGNGAKGLIGSTGPAAGARVLTVSSRLDIEVLSYIRTADGFLTSMHDNLPRLEDGGMQAAIFNPGSNLDQESSLRIYNHESTAAEVRIRAMDDGGGSPGSPVTMTVPGRASRTVSASELESGGGGLGGALGDGRGKWRLRVESDADITAMNLLSNPTGHLTNLSTAPD